MNKKTSVIIAVLIGVTLIRAGFFLLWGLEHIKNLTIDNIDISSIPDGDYQGAFSGWRWSNELLVTVNNGRITDIKVLKDVAIPNDEYTQELFNSVIEKQSLQFDVVSGATVTSKAYLKSIQNALSPVLE
jgi:uncharacterized protein with FMN-binding domain